MKFKNIFKSRKTVPGSIDSWIETHAAVSDVAHNHLLQILQVGPVHPAALGDFRKRYEIPPPIGYWLATFDEIKRITMEESPNGQPAVLLAKKMGDALYWKNYRYECSLGEGWHKEEKVVKKTPRRWFKKDGYFKRLFRAILGQWGAHERMLRKWETLLLNNPMQDAQVVLEDGRTVNGALIDVSDGYFTLKVGSGTELLECDHILKIRGISRQAVPVNAAKQGYGSIRLWFPDKQFGFIRGDSQMYFFRRDLIAVSGLAESLDEGKTRQIVHFVIEVEGKNGKNPCVRVDRWLVDHSQVVATSKNKENAYLQGRSCLDKGDLEGARRWFEKVLEKKSDPHYQSALKDLAELINRTDPNAAYDLLERYRADFDEEEVLASFDKMEISYLLRAKRQDDALSVLSTLLNRLGLPISQRQYYLQLQKNIKAGTLNAWSSGDDDALDRALNLFFDGLCQQCDFHGLEERGIKTWDDLPDPAEDEGRSLTELVKMVDNVRASLCEGMAKNDEVLFYHSLEFSNQMMRLELSNACLYKKLGDKKRAMLALRQYFWRKALCLMLADGGYRPEEVLAYLVWRVRPGPVTGGYFAETIPLLICGVLQWTKREELRRIVEDSDYREELTSHFSADPEMRDQLQFWVAFHELNQVLPVLDEIFAGMGIPIQTVESPHSAVRRKIHGLIKERLGELSRNNFAFVAQALKDMVHNSERDHERVNLVIRFLEKAGDYAGTLEYSGRVALAGQLLEMRKEFEKKYVLFDTTLLTTDICYPCLMAAWELVSSDFEKVSSQSIALSLEHAHGTQYFLEDEEVQLRLLLRLEDPTCPPISSVTVSLIGDNAPDDDTGIAYFDGPLNGGDKGREVGISIWPTAEELSARHGVARIRVEYTKQSEPCTAYATTFDLDFSISETEFATIANPYIHCLGHPAKGKMFVGRRGLLDEIVSVFQKTEGGQCYVLYGQRRSGKTSVLHNVKNTLETAGFVYTKISAATCSNLDVVETFTRELEAKLRRDLSEDVVSPDAGGKDWAARLRHMGDYIKNMGTGRLNWVVGIDEFTYLYDFFVENRDANRGAVRNFLRFLKALLEDGVFHLLLIGQESVVQMQKEFPNEFAIWRLHRLTYLGEEAVRQLVDDPIAKVLDNGETVSRYKGNAFQRLFTITAGQPWFTQIFCSRMVEYLNESKTPDITEGVVRAVERRLCEGEWKIESECFEPFVNLMVPEVDEEALVKFYYNIAMETESDAAWVPRSDLAVQEALFVPLLDKRGLVVVRDDKIRLRMGLFASWLRANPGRTAASFGGKAK